MDREKFTNLEKRKEVFVFILESVPLLDEWRHEKINIFLRRRQEMHVWASLHCTSNNGLHQGIYFNFNINHMMREQIKSERIQRLLSC